MLLEINFGLRGRFVCVCVCVCVCLCVCMVYTDIRLYYIYCLYIRIDYKYIDTNTRAQRIKSFLVSNLWHKFNRNTQPSMITIWLPRYSFVCVCVCMHVCVCVCVCVCVLPLTITITDYFCGGVSNIHSVSMYLCVWVYK